MEKPEHCGPLGAPPKTQVERKCELRPNFAATSWICCASSRVGARASTMGPSPGRSAGWNVCACQCVCVCVCVCVRVLLD